MRPIDADALLKEVRENKELYEREQVYLEGLLLNAPTVPLPDFKAGYKQAILDGKPKGEWIYDSDHSITIDMYKCSECSCHGHTHFKFCPNCGADMRGEE